MIKRMEKAGVVVLAHGSRGEQARTSQVLKRVTEGVKAVLHPEVEVVGAALQFESPSLEETVRALVGRGIDRIVITPYFLFSGRHITEDIPEMIEEFKQQYPGKEFILTDILGSDQHSANLVAERIQEAVPELSIDGTEQGATMTPGENIEEESMGIIGKLLPHLGWSDEEYQVVRRIVHAVGDPEIAKLVYLHPAAVPEGIAALKEGRPIFTDVRMVASGISEQVARQFGCSIRCALDEGTMTSQDKSTTRSAAAISALGEKLDNAIVAIGNAPTALIALIELIDKGIAKPRLVVGMPVGFVQAGESKANLMKRDVPYITIEGRRGGSSAAVATVNALLHLACTASK